MSLATTQLAAVGLKAIEFQKATDARKAASNTLEDAYAAWKDGKYIERDTPDWEVMLSDTRPSYDAFLKAKAAERNARDRLARACRKVDVWNPPVNVVHHTK